MLLKTNIISIANLFHFVNSKQPTMNWRKYARLTLLLAAFVMLLYQSHKAFELLMDPPMIETTSETSIKNVRQPMMYLCPSFQYNMTKLQKLGYKHKVALIFGQRSNDTLEGIWRAHFNKTWEQMIRDTLNLSLEEFIENT